jgi:hypothetical protein
LTKTKRFLSPSLLGSRPSFVPTQSRLRDRRETAAGHRFHD